MAKFKTDNIAPYEGGHQFYREEVQEPIPNLLGKFAKQSDSVAGARTLCGARVTLGANQMDVEVRLKGL
jgi:hypothetical protein